LVNENLTKKRLKKIEDNIKAMDLLETFIAMSDLEECMSCLEELLDKKTIEKKE
jgi:guanylate kinase